MAINIKLVGVSLAELELALKYSGLFVDSDERGDYAEIKAIPAFLLGSVESNNVRCGCDAYRKLGEHKERMEKIKKLIMEEDMAQVHFGHVEKLPHSTLEFWEKLGNKTKRKRRKTVIDPSKFIFNIEEK